MSNKRILIFSIAYYPHVGGAEVAVKEITDRLGEYEFDLITLRFNKKDKEEEKFRNVTVYRIGGPKNLFPFTAFLKAWRLHKKRKYTHMWAIMANWAGLAAMFFKFKYPGVKFVLTLQEGDSLEKIKRKTWFISPLFKKIFLKADVIQAISNFLGNWSRQMGYQGRVEVVPNGVDYKMFDGSCASYVEKNIILVTTSRLVEKNGIASVLDALSLLPEEVKFRVIGSGPLLTQLTEQVRRNKLGNRVKFLGFMDMKEIPAHLHSSHIFIRPSLSEGMGNSFIEAMAAGLPVIATPVGGIPDFLFDPDKNKSHPPTGLLVNVNDPQDIARQVNRLIKNPKLRETITTNAKRMVKERYDWNLIAGEMKTRVFDKR